MRPSSPHTTYLSPTGSEFSTPPTCEGLWCSVAPVLDHLMILVWIGIVGLVVIATLLYLPRAKEICAEEWARTRSERDAFEAFVRRVGAIDLPAIQVHDGGLGVAPLSQAHDGVQQVERVKDVYRNTIMDVPHYEEEYDETLREHMAAEFSEDIATAICDGGTLTPQLQQALVHHGREARDEREALLEALDEEVDSLSAATPAIRDLDASLAAFSERRLRRLSFDELTGAYRELHELRGRVRELVEERQRTLHEGVHLGRRLDDASHFYAYLYHPLDVTYPVLADGTTLVDEIERARSRVVQAISRRV